MIERMDPGGTSRRTKKKQPEIPRDSSPGSLRQPSTKDISECASMYSKRANTLLAMIHPTKAPNRGCARDTEMHEEPEKSKICGPV